MNLVLAAMQLLAHQGGWDEILMVAAPLLILGGLLWLANRRAKQAASEAVIADGASPEGNMTS